MENDILRGLRAARDEREAIAAAQQADRLDAEDKALLERIREAVRKDERGSVWQWFCATLAALEIVGAVLLLTLGGSGHVPAPRPPAPYVLVPCPGQPTVSAQAPACRSTRHERPSTGNADPLAPVPHHD